jgi:hypothetical protein
MSLLNVDKIDPNSGTALEIGTSGDTVTVPSGVGLTLTNSTLLLPTTITSTTEVKTNKISPATGTAFALGDSGDTFTVPSGATIVNSGTATGFGGGKVLQTIVGTQNAQNSTSSGSFVTTTLTAAITPSATSSKVAFFMSSTAQITAGIAAWDLYDSVNTSFASGGQARGLVGMEGNTGSMRPISFTGLLSPSTTSAITYSVYFLISTGTVYFGRTDTLSSLVLMEIGV